MTDLIFDDARDVHDRHTMGSGDNCPACRAINVKLDGLEVANAKVQRLTDSENARIVLLEAENKRLRGELQTAHELLEGDAWTKLTAERDRLCSALLGVRTELFAFAMGSVAEDPSMFARRLYTAVVEALKPRPATERSLLEDFPELANVRVTFDPRRNVVAHTYPGLKAAEGSRDHPAHDGQTCEEYEAALPQEVRDLIGILGEEADRKEAAGALPSGSAEPGVCGGGCSS